MKYLVRILFWGSIAAVIYFAALCIWYLTMPTFYDHIEPHVAVVSYLFLKGNNVYHDLLSPERYSMLYGPMLYIINSLSYLILGASFFAAKIGGVIASFACIILLYFTIRKRNPGNKTIPVIYTGYVVLIFMLYKNFSFYNRPDPFLFMLVSLGLFTVVNIKNKLIAPVLAGLALGIAVNLKVHAVLYFIPILVLLFAGQGAISVLLALIISAGTAVSPFLLFNNISFSNYVVLLKLAGLHGFSVVLFVENITFLFLYLLIPVLVLICMFLSDPVLLWRNRVSRTYLLTLAACIAVVIFIAGKLGSGSAHMIPFTILCAYLLTSDPLENEIPALKRGSPASQTIIYFIVWFFILSNIIPTAFRSQYKIVKRLGSIRKHSNKIVKDIRSVLKKHPGMRVEMGAGKVENYGFTFFRPQLVFEQDKYFIDPAALMDMKLSRLKIPPSTLDHLKRGEIDIFIIPVNSPPFALISYYGNYDPRLMELFDKEFIKTFLKNYEPVGRSKYYDLWRHKKHKPVIKLKY
ncbi:ArnT family glycosyltransferase [Candidatus Auribacterota bacterium]